MINLASPLVQKIRNGDRLFSIWQGNLGMMRFQGAQCAGQALRNVTELCDAPSVELLFDQFKGIPAIVVAAGPSLDKNLHLLKDLNDRALVITINRCAPIFQAMELRPHFIVASDHSELLPDVHLDGIKADVLENLVLRLSVHPRMMNLPGQRTWLFTDGSTHENGLLEAMDKPTRPIGGGSVSHTAFQLAYYLGCNPITLIGQDLAYSNHQAYSSLDLDADQQLTILEGEATAEFRGDDGKLTDVGGGADLQFQLEKVRGWAGGEVYTSHMLRRFIEFYELLAPVLAKKGDHLFINATEGGAHIEGLEPMPLAEAIERHMSEPIGDLRGRIAEVHGGYVPQVQPGTMADQVRELERQMRRLHKMVRECEKLVHSNKRTQRTLERVTERHQKIREIFLSYEFFLRDMYRGKQSMETPAEETWGILQCEFRAMRKAVQDLLPWCREAVQALQ